MNETSTDISEAPSGPTYLRVYFVSALLIAVGLSTLSARAAIALGIILMPAHMVAVGLIARIQPWRPIFLRIWPVTAFVIALLFLLPGRIIYQMATTPVATFKQLVLNPVPDGVTNIEKKEQPGSGAWVSLTFDADRMTIDKVLASQDYAPVSSDNIDGRLKEQVGRIQLEGAKIYEANFPESGIRFTAVVNSRSNRMCVVYDRSVR
jgi:hypothetical protein